MYTGRIRPVYMCAETMAAWLPLSAAGSVGRLIDGVPLSAAGSIGRLIDGVSLSAAGSVGRLIDGVPLSAAGRGGGGLMGCQGYICASTVGGGVLDAPRRTPSTTQPAICMHLAAWFSSSRGTVNTVPYIFSCPHFPAHYLANLSHARSSALSSSHAQPNAASGRFSP